MQETKLMPGSLVRVGAKPYRHGPFLTALGTSLSHAYARHSSEIQRVVSRLSKGFMRAGFESRQRTLAYLYTHTHIYICIYLSMQKISRGQPLIDYEKWVIKNPRPQAHPVVQHVHNAINQSSSIYKQDRSHTR